VTGLDWIIIGVVLLLAVVGWAQGIIAGALALAGFALGALAGTRLAPLLLSGGSEAAYAPAFALIGALVAGAVLAGVFEGVGARLRARVRSPALGAIDGLLGSVLTACVGLGIMWVLGAMALQSGERDLRRTVQRSEILSRLNDTFPPSGALLRAIRRFDPVPEISGPNVDLAPPTAAIARDPQVRAAAAGVVKVQGTACGLGVEGSGWVASDGLVVTNAHVVAGQDDTQVFVRGEDPALAARAVAFDERNDVAVLRVEGLQAPALPIADAAEPGTSAAILGFPQNGPYDVRAGRVGDTRAVVTQDAYGQGPLRREITTLRGLVRSGNSGGPMVDGRGRVLTTIFAASTTQRRVGYGVPNAIVREALGRARRARGVSTGPCVAG
jgi:S1-C subfamily serine protease